MNIKWGKQNERYSYDRIVTDHLQNILREEVGIRLTDLPKIMRPAFDNFKDGKVVIWNPIEIGGIMIAAGVTISGTYKEGVEGRIFPLDAGAWVANHGEIMNAIISQVELQVDSLTESFDEEARKRIINFSNKLIEKGIPITDEIVADFNRLHHLLPEQVFLGEKSKYSEGSINIIKDQLRILESSDLDWVEMPSSVISVDSKAEIGLLDLPNTIINPFTGEPMEKWTGLPGIAQYRGHETYNMPEFLEEEIKLLGLDPFNVYDEKLKLPYFAVAENGAKMVQRNIGGRFGGFMWDIPPAGRMRFFRGLTNK